MQQQFLLASISSFVSSLMHTSQIDFKHHFDRFKLIFGYLQLDNQLPLTLMPVLLAPDQTSDVQHPVFKMTITMQNENKDGVLVYPYVYIRVCSIEFDAKT